MRALLRSTIICGPNDPSELLIQNILALDTSGLQPDVKEERSLWGLVRDFAKLHQHPPDLSTVRLQLSSTGDLSTLDYLEQMLVLPAKLRGDFAILLDKTIEERRRDALLESMREARETLTTGRTVEDERGKKQVLRGVDEASTLLRAALRPSRACAERHPGLRRRYGR